MEKINKDSFEDFCKKILENFPKSSHKNSQKVSRCGSCYPICTHWLPFSKEDTLVDFLKPQLVQEKKKKVAMEQFRKTSPKVVTMKYFISEHRSMRSINILLRPI
jgi:hypothetical protein